MRKPRENTYAGLVHLLNAVPLWGLLFCGWVWFSFREESREVVTAAERAMTFHVLLMCSGLIWIMVWLLARLITTLAFDFGDTLIKLNHAVMIAIYVAYVTVCLRGSLEGFAGRPFNYPIIRPGGPQGGTKP